MNSMEKSSTFTFCPETPMYKGFCEVKVGRKTFTQPSPFSFYCLALRRYSWPLFVCLALQPRYLKALPSLNLRPESDLS